MSPLLPKGAPADSIFGLTQFLFWTALAVFVVVMAALAYAVLRPRASGHDEGDAAPDDRRRMTRVVVVGVAVTTLILFAHLGVSFATDRAMAEVEAPDAMQIQVVGHQWWWDVTYQDTVPSNQLRTSNEIHVPVGRAILLKMSSRDVIHSMWIPNLHGKKDLIPGHWTTTYFRADTPGVYRAQCAEFCGLQHARMALWVVAHPQADFDRWYVNSLRPAQQPADSVAQRGREVFLAGSCTMCHTIRGTSAASNVGPDLTHLGGRLSLAAGSLPNTRGHLQGWIANPHGVKPGVRMPANDLSPSDLNAIVRYLESLK